MQANGIPIHIRRISGSWTVTVPVETPTGAGQLFINEQGHRLGVATGTGTDIAWLPFLSIEGHMQLKADSIFTTIAGEDAGGAYTTFGLGIRATQVGFGPVNGSLSVYLSNLVSVYGNQTALTALAANPVTATVLKATKFNMFPNEGFDYWPTSLPSAVALTATGTVRVTANLLAYRLAAAAPITANAYRITKVAAKEHPSLLNMISVSVPADSYGYGLRSWVWYAKTYENTGAIFACRIRGPKDGRTRLVMSLGTFKVAVEVNLASTEFTTVRIKMTDIEVQGGLTTCLDAADANFCIDLLADATAGTWELARPEFYHGITLPYTRTLVAHEAFLSASACMNYKPRVLLDGKFKKRVNFTVPMNDDPVVTVKSDSGRALTLYEVTREGFTVQDAGGIVGVVSYFSYEALITGDLTGLS
jgi:hypothetical protein